MSYNTLDWLEWGNGESVACKVFAFWCLTDACAKPVVSLKVGLDLIGVCMEDKLLNVVTVNAEFIYPQNMHWH